jgi:CRISPR-associated protein Cmr6
MSASAPSRRATLEKAEMTATPNVGLWLDKYLKEQTAEGGESAKTGHFKEAAGKRISDVYQVFFQRWKQSLEQAGAVTRQAQVQGRLAIGLGGESALETSITLHRTYGVPYIPGSALKGLAARYARNRLEEQTWKKGSDAYKILFGDTAEAGYVTFFDALYIPSSAKQDCPLALDVITVHHPEYYRGKNLPPADWDNPIPVPFLNTTGSYLMALHGPENWVEAAFEILQLALAEEGVGAKTSSGYGRMSVGDVTSDDDKLDASTDSAADDPEQAIVTSFLLRLEQMPDYKVAGEIHGVYQQWQGVDISDTGKRKIAQAILDKIESAGRTKKSAKKKWFQELESFIAGYSSTGGK